MSARLLTLSAIMATAVSAAPQAENTTPTYALGDPVYVTPTYALGDPVYATPTYALGDPVYATPTYALGDPVYATPTYALGDPVYFTTVVSSYTTYCPKATTIVHNGKTITAHGPTTLTITDCPCTITTKAPPAASSAAGDCLSKCNAEHDKCVYAPDANMSLCAAKYSECLGYNPWGSGSYVTPTACAAGAASTKPPAVVPTAAAGRVAIPGALAALGALAML